MEKVLHHDAYTKDDKGCAAENDQGARISTMMLKNKLRYTKEKYQLHEALAATSLICPSILPCRQDRPAMRACG